MEVVWGVGRSVEFGGICSKNSMTRVLMKLSLYECLLMRFSTTYKGCIIKIFEEKERERISKSRVEKPLRDGAGFRDREVKIWTVNASLQAVHWFQCPSPHCTYFLGFCEVPT